MPRHRLSVLAVLLWPAVAALAQTPPAPAPAASAGGPGYQSERSFPAIAEGRWTGRRLPDGQPDVQGHWSNTIANHNNFTDPQGGIINDPQASAPGRRPLPPRDQRAPSRVSDPPDGHLPFQPWAAAKVKDFQDHFNHPVKPEYIEPLARCAPAGIPKSFYWHGYEIRQYPGYVVFLFNSGTRIIHLDDKPALPDSLKLWNGDSRGRWVGNTLVVTVRNHNGKALLGRSGEFVSENAKIEERYVFAPDNQRFNYVASFDDPEVYTRPWTATIPARRWTEADKPNGWHFEASINTTAGRPVLERDERICTENNGGFGRGAAVARSR